MRVKVESNGFHDHVGIGNGKVDGRVFPENE